MFNFITSSLINLLVLWLDRITEYLFFYDRDKNIKTRFLEKRKYKLFVLKLIWIDVQLLFIESFRDIRECWTDHVFPSRFYSYCWEDAKLFVQLYLFWKTPTIIYWFNYWNYYQLDLMFPWNYKLIKSEMSLFYRFILYVYEGNCASNKMWFNRPYYENRYNVTWCLLNTYLVYIFFYRLLTVFIWPFSIRVLQRGLDKYPEADRIYDYEWMLGYYYIYIYKNFIISYNKYINNWNDLDMVNSFNHVYGGLYKRNSRLYTLKKLDRDYLLWRFVSDSQDKPDIYTKVMKRDKAKFQWKKAQEYYENNTSTIKVKENILVKAIVYIFVNVFLMTFLITYTLLRVILAPFKLLFKTIMMFLTLLWKIIVYIFKLDI